MDGELQYLVGKYFTGKGKDLPNDKFDQDQLTKGRRHELEHTSSEELAEIIAKDHLAENPQYYSILELVEGITSKTAVSTWFKRMELENKKR